MSTPSTSSGTRVFIAAAVTAEPANAAAYAALSWTEIGDIEEVPPYGDESSIITATTLQDQRVFKAKGPRDAGTLGLICLDRPDDTGQVAALAAEASPFNHPIKVELNNKLTIGGTNQLDYFIGLVTSRVINIGDGNSIIRRVFNIAINSAVTTTAAT